MRAGIGLAAEIDQVDLGEGVAEEVGPEALELFDGVCGVEGAGGFGGCRSQIGEVLRYGFGCGVGGGVGGVDDGEGVVERGEGAVDGGFEERVVGAAEEERLGVGGFGESFLQVDLEDFVGDGVVDPAFFDERDEEGAGFFGGLEAERGEGVRVGVGLDGGGGGQDEDVGCLIGMLWRFGQNAGVLRCAQNDNIIIWGGCGEDGNLGGLGWWRFFPRPKRGTLRQAQGRLWGTHV